jgi:hypothetical protein
MSSAVKEAALTWCGENDVPTVELLLQADLDDDLVAHVHAAGVKPGGVQDKMLRKRLAEARGSSEA